MEVRALAIAFFYAIAAGLVELAGGWTPMPARCDAELSSR